MKTVLSVENARSWSWGLVVRHLAKSLSNDYKFIRMTGRIKSWGIELCNKCGEVIPVRIPPVSVSNDVVNSFDLTLVQNVDSLSLVNSKKMLIGRMGGMRTFDESLNNANLHRFDDDLASAAAIIATNNQLFQIAEPMNDNTFLIPNGVDIQMFKPKQWDKTLQQTLANTNGKPFIVGFAGNIHSKYAMYYKGWKVYVQATLRLRPGVETLNFLYLHNQIPHKDMPKKFYHKIDCLILPTVNEGCSNVVTEALACGVPVLLTKVGFHGEQLEDGVNCLFIERDIDSITTKIRLLMHDPELREKLAFNGRLFAESNHDITKLADEYRKVFQLVLSNKK